MIFTSATWVSTAERLMAAMLRMWCAVSRAATDVLLDTVVLTVPASAILSTPTFSAFVSQAGEALSATLVNILLAYFLLKIF